MSSPRNARVSALCFALSLAGAAPAAAQFVVDSSKIPSGSDNNSTTENVDFADVDLDGDWDVAMADGGDDGNDQNRLWINQGGLQGGSIGFFADRTSAQFPSISDDSRDIEFGDFDGDGDHDIYVSNTAQLQNQSNRWIMNMGGKQGGTAGYFQDESAARWIGLGGPGSSIAPQFVLGNGGFIDWSCDCDFGDLDNDGDLDLVHSSYGGAFGGNVPTRLFLNDGDGNFEEFNPSGWQLTSQNISNGMPALWASGTQSANTSSSNGSFADVAQSALDIDVGDLDGDFDLDILHGARNETPRIFLNRLEEQGGGTSLPPFRDVTSAAFPPGWATGGGNYEQELGDMDGDGDLDIYGLNWDGFSDRTFRNDGTADYALVQGFGDFTDDNEVDFLDYDNDGDLDVYVANFSGQDKLYRNTNGNGSYSSASLPGFSATSLDADACDTDNDGDYDVLVAEDNNRANTFLRNTTGTPDTHAPYIPRIEDLPSTSAAAGQRAIRAQVYDNAPYYITWYNPTALEVFVGGVRLPDVPMVTSQGQIFRGVVPRNLVGTVSYRVRSSDEYGNTGTSGTESYSSSGSAPGTLYGSGTNGTLGVPAIDALSLALPGSPLFLHASNVPSATPLFFGLSTGQSGGIDLSNGLRLNVALPILLLHVMGSDSSGDAVWRLDLPPAASGLTLYSQAIAFNGTSGNDFASSRGLRIDVP